MSQHLKLDVKEIDCLLDELEKQATSQVSSNEFFSHLLDRFQAVVGGDCAAILVSSGDGSLFLRSSVGVLPSNFPETVARNRGSISTPSPTCFQHDEGGTFFAFHWPIEQPSTGCLVVGYSRNQVSKENPALYQLGAAFAELLQIHSLNKFQELIANRWTVWCKVSESLTQTSSYATASKVMVDGLQRLLVADRVSLVDSASFGLEKPIVEISGHRAVKTQNSTAKSLAKIASQVCSKKQLQFSSSDNDSHEVEKGSVDEITGLFHNLIAFPLVRENEANWAKRTVVIAEWKSKHRMLDGLTAISMLFSPMGILWCQQKRWLLLPRWIRAWAELSVLSWVFRASLRFGTWLFSILVFLAFANFLLSQKEMLVEADAILEPSNRRAIFASADGFIKHLNTDVGMRVRKGQLLVELSSPSLEIQIEETRGETLAILEKQNGLEVALSQISQNSGDNEANRTRVSADIALLRSQAITLREKLDLLNMEKTRLKIESPIDGTVISRNLRSELESRPVRRGDALFAVADLDGSWQMQVRVADRDTNYLLEKFDVQNGKVKVVFDSLPDSVFEGKIMEVGMTLESTLDRGVFLPIIVSIDSRVASNAKIGSTAKVLFSCGAEPLWLVWSRPAVNFAKKNYWFYFSRHIQ